MVTCETIQLMKCVEDHLTHRSVPKIAASRLKRALYSGARTPSYKVCSIHGVQIKSTNKPHKVDHQTREFTTCSHFFDNSSPVHRTTAAQPTSDVSDSTSSFCTNLKHYSIPLIRCCFK